VNEHIVIVAGAEPIDEHVIAAVPPAAIVLGVDSGFDHAFAAGLRPNGLIGDLDSVSDEGRAWAEEHATISRHAADKDETDTELAVAFAAAMAPERLTLIGGGDRLDHTIAAIGALNAPSVTSIPRLDAWWDGQHIDVLHGPCRQTLLLDPASTVSLVVLGRPCTGLSVSGVRWPLDDVRLEPVVGHGVSNEVTDPNGEVRISLSSGVLTVFDRPLHDRQEHR
jgi:thiamine pyrophosphokinase